MAKRIDRFRTPHPTQEAALLNLSFRKYTWNKEKKRQSRSRIGRGLAFCANLRARLARIPEEKMDDPLDVPFVEIGYSNDMPTRFDNHRSHSSSSSILNLFEAICHLQWPDEFNLWQFVIHCCCKPDRVALGEIFFTQLCEGYIHNAGGFSTYPAGRSVFSAYNQEYGGWAEADEWVVKNMLVEENHAREQEKWEANIEKQRVESKGRDSDIVPSLQRYPVDQYESKEPQKSELGRILESTLCEFSQTSKPARLRVLTHHTEFPFQTRNTFNKYIYYRERDLDITIRAM